MNPYILTDDFLHKKVYLPSGKYYVESTKLHSNLDRIAATVLFMVAEEQLNKERK